MKYEIWACEIEFLTEYAERLANATAQERTEAFSRFGEKQTPSIVSIVGREAQIKLEGALSQNGPSPLARFFGMGGTSYIEFADAIVSAADDDSIDAIRVPTNSAGGRVIGVEEAARAVAYARTKKPVIFENHGIIASAAYWLASQGTEIVATSPLSLTGSIGVKATIMDKTDEGLAAQGIKRLHIISDNAPNKTDDISSDLLRQEIKQKVNATERVFLARVANGRGITVAQVKEKFGQGAVFLAQDPSGENPDAISAGMIDGLVEGASITPSTAAVEITPTVAEIKTPTEKKKMTLKELLASDPGAKAEYDAALKVAADTARDAVTADYKARFEAVKPFLGSEEYASAEDIREAGLQVMAGDLETPMFKMMVTMHDKIKATLDTKAAAGEGEEVPPTPAQGAPVVEDDYDKILKADKAAVGEVS